MGSDGKSYMRKGFPIYEEMNIYFTIHMRRPLVIYDFGQCCHQTGRISIITYLDRGDNL